MIDDGQGLHGSRPVGRADTADGTHIERLAAAFTVNKPAVTIVVKKRRGAAEPQDDRDAAEAVRGHGDTPGEERRPRVYQLRTSASTPSRSGVEAPVRPEQAAQAERAAPATQATPPLERDDRQAAEAHASPAVATWPVRRRRARRDPTRAPGQVTRIVFEAAPPMPLAQPAEADAPQPEFIEHAEVGYERVMAELQQLRTQLDLAVSARKFRIR